MLHASLKAEDPGWRTLLIADMEAYEREVNEKARKRKERRKRDERVVEELKRLKTEHPSCGIYTLRSSCSGCNGCNGYRLALRTYDESKELERKEREDEEHARWKRERPFSSIFPTKSVVV
jgi:hypothetical protein